MLLLATMNLVQQRNMPIGIQDFPSMIEGNYAYVDKTQFIPQLEILGRAYFLTRPRRFGKSLFISTLQAYFEGKKELFKGLAIEKFKEENNSEWKKYPVLKLDLNAQKYIEEEDLIDEFLDSIKENDIERVLILMKNLIASIPYDSFLENQLELREHNYQSAIYLVFRLLGQYIKTEVHSSKGRSDAEVELEDSIYIFEFKMEGSTQEAIIQIKNMGYAEKHKACNKNIFLIGVTIDQTKRTLGNWLIEKLQ